MKKEVLLWTGAGQIGMAIARRVGYGKTIVVGDRSLENAQRAAGTIEAAGFDVIPMEMDLSSRTSIRGLIQEGQRHGEITMLVNAAGVSPSQAPIETILQVDLYGTAVLLEEVGRVITPGGAGVTISSQSGHRMPALTPEEDALLACTPISWPRGATRSVSCSRQCGGGSGAPASTLSPRGSWSPPWRWMSSTARGGIFIGTCLPSAPPDGRGQRTRSPTWPSC